MKIVYPACFYDNGEGYTVVFPDLKGCVTEGSNMIEAMEMAEEAAADWLLDEIEDKNQLPNISDMENIVLDKEMGKGFINIVAIDLNKYERIFSSQSVKKTLTIPNWLNTAAEKSGINFSQTLQEALMQKLNLVK